MGLKPPKTPNAAPPPPPPPDLASQAVQSARMSQDMAERRRKGRNRTLLTSAMGDTSTPKTLLGQ